jgi:prefoldin subunit 5
MRQYEHLNPAELQRQIVRLQNRLQELVLLKEEVRNAAKPIGNKKSKSCYTYV